MNISEPKTGIPVPKRCSGVKTTVCDLTLAIRKLNVGESIDIDEFSNGKQTQANTAGKRAGFKVVTRKIEGGLRIWRIA